MNPNDRLWQTIVEPYRAADWQECVRLAREAVDLDPQALDARFLLAESSLKLENHGLALLQYERLLPLAVGAHDLFAALAAQRRLDELQPAGRKLIKRYAAMHQWFASLATQSSPGAGAAASADARDALMALAAFDFGRAAEFAQLRFLDADPGDLELAPGRRWVVVFGRVRWTSDESGESRASLGLAGASLPEAGVGRALVRLEPEIPTLCLGFEVRPARPDAASAPGGNPLDEGRAAA